MNERITFKAGDQVRLKTGGPAMVIREIVEEGYFVCRWFKKDGMPHTAKFFAHELVSYKPPAIDISAI